MLSDFHTHIPKPGAIVNVAPWDLPRLAATHPSALFSVGIHPWDLPRLEQSGQLEEALTMLEHDALHPQVVAIGETGLDALRGGDMAAQLAIFQRHIKLSERVEKPLVLHVVRTGHEILRLRKELGSAVKQPWVWHGFRGNPTQAAQFLAMPATYLSIGERFNPRAVEQTPLGRLLTETDESLRPVAEIAAEIAVLKNIATETVEASVAENIARIIHRAV